MQTRKITRILVLSLGIFLIISSACIAFSVLEKYSNIIEMFQGSVNKKIKDGTPLTKQEKKIILLPGRMGLGMVRVEALAFLVCFIGCILVCFSQHLFYENQIKFNKVATLNSDTAAAESE
jgi:hypothetical protein